MALENRDLDSYKVNVKAASTIHVDLTTVYPVIDGYQTEKGDRILLKNQTDAKENGIYVCLANGLSLAFDMDNNTSYTNGAFTRTTDGVDNINKEFYCPPIKPTEYYTTNKNWVETPFVSLPAVDNVGTGEGEVYRDSVGNIINLKTLKQGNGITITNNSDDITISTQQFTAPAVILQFFITDIQLDQTVSVSADDLITDITGGTQPYMIYAISKDNGVTWATSIGNPALAILTFDCSDAGNNIPVLVGVSDINNLAGYLTNYTETSVSIQDNMGYC